MTDLVALRAAFADFLGQERFLKFVARGFQPRLKFWQEQAVDSFYAEHPMWSHDLSELEEALRFCHVHGCDLLGCKVPTYVGFQTLSSTYVRDRRAHFPHAAVDAQMVPEGGPASIASWYCPDCRSEAERRQQAHWRASGMPEGPMLFTVVEALHIVPFNMLAVRVAEDLDALGFGAPHHTIIWRPDGSRLEAHAAVEYRKKEPFGPVLLTFHGLSKEDAPVGSTIEVAKCASGGIA